MSIGITQLTSGSDATNLTAYASASVSPGTNRLVLFGFASNSSIAAEAPTDVSGANLTFTKITDVTLVGAVKLSLWRALGSPTSGAITATLANTQTAALWAIWELDAVDVGGTNGADAVVQSATNAGTGTGLTVTLGAFSSANNATFAIQGWFAVAVSAATATPGSGFTEYYDFGLTEAGTSGALEGQFRIDNDTSADVTWSATSAGIAGIAIEVKQSTAVTPKRLLLMGVG